MQVFLFSTLATSGYNENAANTTGMLFACWAIVLVLLAMSFVFLRSGKKEYSVAILPLPITPFIYIISGVIARLVDDFIPLSFIELRVTLILTAGLVSCLLLGLASLGIPGRRTRHVFFWFCAAFVVVLTLVLVINQLVDARIPL